MEIKVLDKDASNEVIEKYDHGYKYGAIYAALQANPPNTVLEIKEPDKLKRESMRSSVQGNAKRTLKMYVRTRVTPDAVYFWIPEESEDGD